MNTKGLIPINKGLLIIVVIGAIVFFGFSQTGSIIGGIEYTSTSIKTDTSQYTEFTHSWVGVRDPEFPRDTDTGFCTVGGEVHNQPRSALSRTNMPSGLSDSYNKKIDISGARIGSTPVENAQGWCSLTADGDKVSMFCTFSGKVLCGQLPSRPFEGILNRGGSVDVRIPKNGIFVSEEVIGEQMTQTPEETVITDNGNIECIDNIGCTEICGDTTTPTCEDNLCRCDSNLVFKESGESGSDGVNNFIQKIINWFKGIFS